MHERVYLVDKNYNDINPPPNSKKQREVVCLADDVLPHFEYFEYFEEEEGRGETNTEGSYLGSDNSYTLDDDRHWDCRLGGYSNCPDNPAR
jgi:hypothetical protein